MKKVKLIFFVALYSAKKYIHRFSKKKGVSFLILLFLFSLTAILKFNPLDLNHPTINEGLVGIYAPSSLPSSATHFLSQPLVTLDKKGLPQPNLALSWQVNNNATLYTFKIKNDLFWQDGKKVESYQIKFDLSETEISYPDSSTIQFKLADSFAPFPTFLTTPIFKNQTLIGLGQYRVAEQHLSQGVISKLVLTPTIEKSLPKIIIRFYPDEKTAQTAFALGEIDALVGISNPEQFPRELLLKERKIASYSKLTAIFYNTRDPMLSDKNLRRALSFATPEVEGEERAKTPIPSFSWAYNSEAKDYLNNQEVAKGYLEKSSWDKTKTITLTTTPNLSSLGGKIIRAWQKTGIEAILRVESGVPQNFQALLIEEIIPSDPDQYSLWHSTQGKTNLSGYSNPRVDKDLEDGRKTNDLEVRKEKYLDFQKVLIEDAPATFLYFPKLNIIYRSKAEKNLEKILKIQFPTM